VNYNGITGWTAAGLGNDYWLEAVSGGSGTSDSDDFSGSPQQSLVSVPVSSSSWGVTYILQVNVATCVVNNGSEIIAQEISRFAARIAQLNGPDQLLAAYRYLTPAVPVLQPEPGEVESFRRELVWQVSQVANCSNPIYQVGERQMDSSGLGNIMYGFYTDHYQVDWSLADNIANTTQIISSRDLLHFYDNSDDLNQRLVGESLSRRMTGNSVSQSTVEEVAALFQLR
jgi:hypothetical protein